MALSKTLQTALDDQIQKEYYSSYLYLAMSAYLEAQNLPGMAKWTRIQSQEELGHAMKLFDHVVARGGRVTLAAIQQPPQEYGTALELFQKVLQHEEFVAASIHALYALAVKDQDYPAQIMLQWFVTEQVEEEKNAGEVALQLQAVGESKTSLMLLDRHLGKRVA
jgi:ferritin